MKKTMVRIVAALLVAMLALTLLPMGAFAIDALVYESRVYEEVYSQKNGSMADCLLTLGSKGYPEGSTIKTSNYAPIYVHTNGDLYDFSGFSFIDSSKYWEESDKIWTDPTLTPEQQLEAEYKLQQSIKLNFVNKDLKVDPFPTDPTKQKEWYDKWQVVIAGYTPHQHAMSRWYSDGTTHWKECLSCKKYLGMYNQFMYQNWCQDGDEDGICNVCGGDVPYHDITVIEEEGGKITVNRDNACHRMKITADVEPAEGYKLKKLHFTKIRDNGSEQEITRYKKDGQFWTYMPTYDLEVSAEFVKVKTKK